MGGTWLLEWVPAAPGHAGVPYLIRDREASSGPLLLSRAQMEGLMTARPPSDPALFIFHVGHCRSTLLARLLDADDSLGACIEPNHLGTFFARTYGLPPDRFSSVASTLIRTCGLGLAEGQRLVIKFASHGLHRLHEILDLFPDVPAVLVYRDPQEVVRALSAVRWGFLTRRPQWLIGLDGLEDGASMTAEELGAAYLHGLLRRSCEGVDRFARLINYDEVPDVVHELRTRVLGLPGGVDPQALERALRRHSKDPDQPYEARSEAYTPLVSPSTRATVRRVLRPYYDALESARRAAAAGDP